MKCSRSPIFPCFFLSSVILNNCIWTSPEAVAILFYAFSNYSPKCSIVQRTYTTSIYINNDNIPVRLRLILLSSQLLCFICCPYAAYKTVFVSCKYFHYLQSFPTTPHLNLFIARLNDVNTKRFSYTSFYLPLINQS